MLVGAPGGGKTVFLTRVAAALAHACLGRPRELDPSLNLSDLRLGGGALPVPIVLDATRIDKQEGKGRDQLLRAILEEFAQAGMPPTSEELNEALTKGRYVLLVDAIDEISGAARRLAVVDLLKGLSALDCYPNLRIVATTRSARYTGGLAFGPEFELINVTPFVWKQVESFCTNWTNIRKRDKLYYSDLLAAVSGLAEQVEKGETDEAMTSNPLMLTAICMVFERYNALPDDRARLCSLLVDDLCRSRNSEDIEHAWRFSDANKRDLLERIALAMQEEGAQTWPLSRAVEIAMRGVPRNEQLREQRAAKHLHWAAEHTGLLRFQQPERGEEEIRFWHRLFREFLAASRLSQEDVTVNILVESLWKSKHLANPFWEDVVRLLPRALGTLEKAKSLIQQLRHLASVYPGSRGRLLGLLAAGIIESRDLFPDLDVVAHAKEFAQLFETEGGSWPLRDRLLFLQGLGGLDPANGDPRLEHERWVPIPGGKVTIDEHKNAPVQPFSVAWGPVTVQEFRCFVQDKDCFSEKYWLDAPNEIKRSPDRFDTLGWRKQIRHLNYPVVNVTLWDAMAYCRWKTSKRSDGRVIRLLTPLEQRRVADEAGFTQAALRSLRQQSGDKVPGNLPNLAIGHCSPAGAFAPFGKVPVVDLIGNVLEWPHIPRGPKRGPIELPTWLGCFFDWFSDGLEAPGGGVSASFLGFRCALEPLISTVQQ